MRPVITCKINFAVSLLRGVGHTAIALSLIGLGILPRWLFAQSAGGDYQVDSYSLGAGGGSVMAGGDIVSRGLAGQAVLPPNLGISAAGDYSDRGGFYNPAHFTYQRTLPIILSLPGGNATLTLPAGAVGKDVFDIMINKDVLSSPLLSGPGEVAQANSRIVQNEGAWSSPLAANIEETIVFDEQSSWLKPFSSGGTLSMAYRDDNNDGIIDGTNPPVRAETAMIWTLDRSRDVWVKAPAISVDRNTHTIVIPFAAPSVFAILGTLDESVKDVYAFPVPFRPNGANAGIGSGMTGTAADGITFANLPQHGTVEIYTLDGLLVKKLAIPENLVTQQLKWDVRNSAGEKVRSDVYIWRVVSGPNVKSGKLMIIW